MLEKSKLFFEKDMVWEEAIRAIKAIIFKLARKKIQKGRKSRKILRRIDDRE